MVEPVSSWLVWGAGSYGLGDLTQTPETGAQDALSLDWAMAAAALRGALAGGGAAPMLDLVSDGLWTRTTTKQERLTGTTELKAELMRVRLGLQGSLEAQFSGMSLAPSLQVGLRYDGGDAETGFGVELGGTVVLADLGGRITLDVRGRTLLIHEAQDLRDHGFSGGLAFDLDPSSERGPSLALRHDFGAIAGGGIEALYRPGVAAAAHRRWRWRRRSLDGAGGVGLSLLQRSLHAQPVHPLRRLGNGARLQRRVAHHARVGRRPVAEPRRYQK